MKFFQHISLHARLMWIMLSSTALIGTATLLAVFFISYQNHLNDSKQHIEQMMNAVEYSAAIAVYSGNREIADDVIKGLMRAQAICQVALSSNSGAFLISGSPLAPTSECQLTLSHTLYSPFDASEALGRLEAHLNQRVIRISALRAASQLAGGLLALLLLPSVLIWFAVARYITQPIQNFSQQLHNLVPGTAERINSVAHGSKEITRLIADSNFLLTGIEEMLLDERAQRSEIQHLKEQYQHLAHHDNLTGLPNRAMFNDRLQHMLVQARRYELKGALIYLDLDKFKPVNDTLGHDIGDLLLKAVAQRLLNIVRESDTVARLGGDEFALLLPAISSHDDARGIADKVLDSLHQPFIIGAHHLQIGSSLGIAMYPEHGEDEASLIKNADLAMYRAKQNGRNNVQIFQLDMVIT